MGIFDDLLKKAANKLGNTLKQEAKNAIKPAIQQAEDKITDAAADAVAGKIKEAFKPKEKPEAAAAEGEEAAAPFEEAVAACAAAGQAAAEGTETTSSAGEGGLEAFWNGLENEWKEDQARNSGYVWTVSIDTVTALDAAGLAKMKYDLKLSCSHVGPEQNGVYRGSLALAYGADLSGLSAMLGALGGRTSTNRLSGWFRNDNFLMRLSPYSKEKEHAFLHTLDTIIDENAEVVEKPSDNPYADAVASPIIAQMGSGSEAFEKENDPESYWFDWDYHMTAGDLAYSYAVSGVAGMGSAHAEIDETGTHIEGAGRAVSPFGVYSERYEKDYESPFPYVIRVYGNRRVVFELHSPEGGPVVIKFYGQIDSIPVEQTTAV